MDALKGYLIVHNAVSALHYLDLEAFAVDSDYIEMKDVPSITDKQKEDRIRVW